jgi:hypothetical protein
LMHCIAEGSFRFRRLSLFWFHGGCVASPRDRFGSEGPIVIPACWVRAGSFWAQLGLWFREKNAACLFTRI